MTVRVLAVADEVDEGLAAGVSGRRSADLILACGDLPAEYLTALMNATDAPLVFVPGNHDPDLSGYRQTRAGLITRAGFPARVPWPLGAVSADGAVVDAAGLRIAGLGGCVRYGPGPNQYSQRQQTRRARRLSRLARRRARRDQHGVDVLITHAPPRGLGDGDDHAHQGFSCYHDLIADLAPRALLHGHVREGGDSGARRAGATTVCNVMGWRLLDLEPGSGVLTDVRGGQRHAV
ncbi:MAG TPA: metallophosphoesterase [Streptosporangiaceae bacterium]